MGRKKAMPVASEVTKTSEATGETFLNALRHALNHLYDPEPLRTSLLIQLLSLEGQHQAPSKLQQLLLDAIQSLRPTASELPGSAKRRIYQVLQLRYEQQFVQKEVAVQLGLSVRQFRRLQQLALESLAACLVETYGLEERLAELPPVDQRHTNDAGALPPSLQWLRALSPTETTDLNQAMRDVLRLVQPLAERNQKQLSWHSELACAVAMHPLVFRQAMLHLLNAAILHTSGEVVDVTVASLGLYASIAVRVRGGASEPAGDPDGMNIEAEMVRQMLQACCATLDIAAADGGWQAELCCKLVQEKPVLVVDDHAETIDLLKRYLEGARYRLIATQEPQAAVDLAHEEQPLIILLDVMMPTVDGWEVLSRLKQHESTATIPVWVCTVLDQSELALSLGADGFLRKPITREALLAVLDAQAVREPGLR